MSFSHILARAQDELGEAEVRNTKSEAGELRPNNARNEVTSGCLIVHPMESNHIQHDILSCQIGLLAPEFVFHIL